MAEACPRNHIRRMNHTPPQCCGRRSQRRRRTKRPNLHSRHLLARAWRELQGSRRQRTASTWIEGTLRSLLCTVWGISPTAAFTQRKRQMTPLPEIHGSRRIFLLPGKWYPVRSVRATTALLPKRWHGPDEYSSLFAFRNGIFDSRRIRKGLQKVLETTARGVERRGLCSPSPRRSRRPFTESTRAAPVSALPAELRYGPPDRGDGSPE